MKLELKKYKVSLSEFPKNDVPGGILLLDNQLKTFFIDVVAEKETYQLPNGMKDIDVSAIYLRIK